MNGEAAGGTPAEAPDGAAAPVAEQVADQVAAEPEAVDPAPAGPGDDVPDGGEPVMTADRAVDIAQDPAPAPVERRSLFDPHTPTGDGPSMSPAAGATAAGAAGASAAARPPAGPSPTAGPPSSRPVPAGPPAAGASPTQPPAGRAPATDPGADAAEAASPTAAPKDTDAASAVDATTTAVPAASPRPRPRPAPASADPARTPDAPAEEGPTRPTPQSGSPQSGSPQSGSPQSGAPQSGSPHLGKPQLGKPAPATPTATPAPASPGPAAAGSAAAASAAAATAAAASAPTPPGPGTARPATDRFGTDAPTVAVPAAAGSPTAGTAPTDVPADTDSEPTVSTPTWDSEATQVIPLNKGGTATTVSPATGPADPPTERIPVAAGAGAPPNRSAGGEPPKAGRSRRPLLIGAAVVALLAILYVGDLLLSSGSVPRGVTVAGVAVGGMSLVDAEQELRTEIEPRTTVPVEVTAGEVSTQIDPTTAGLAVDWAGTLDRAGEQPLNPITRITSFFTTRELGVATTVDRAAVDGALGELGPIVDKLPTEGTVRFEGVTPIAVDPVPGQQLDQPAAVEVLARDWASGRPVALPLIVLPALTTPEDVAAAIEEVAGPAVSAPVTVVGENDTEGVLEPAVIAEALTFEPGEAGGLEPVLNPTVITDALDDQLAGSEREAVDASLDFSTNPATVVPSQDGRGVDYDATLDDLLAVLTGTGPREITAVYDDQPAEVTTAELESLGSAGVISEFETGGFAADSGQNIRRAAELINGMVVAPGETFSLDAATGPRTAANGYVEAGIIDNGQPARGIAGGVSQVSTTLFNAAYFAGLTDIEHRAHSFYISRYPPGREATIADGAIDMRFRNDTPTAVLIQTVWTPSSVTVRLLGTKYYEVESLTGPRTDPTSPNTVNVPAGEQCNPSQGAPGFTITDTRRLTDVRTGEVRTDPTRTTRYNPSPRVVCG
ncbi:VanW family protein [Pseudonocardia hydrocarbonoxydans]|uniref:VanW family protein n=1 Tax=Pseudonocardia hydrocarbonoxydans TaxID=76726 RepID=UPI001143E3B4|nr:VanW family protein [Pseudonocardia hydrocarbonoxydans]